MLLGPVRERHRSELRRDFPQLDDRRLALLSSLLAQIEAASGYLDRRGLLDQRSGETRAIVERLDRWRTQAWRMLSELEAARGAQPGASFEAHLAQLTAGDDD